MRQVPALDASPFGIVGNDRVARHFQHYLHLLDLPVRAWARRVETRPPHDALSMCRNGRLGPEQRAQASGFYWVLSGAPTAEMAARDLRALGFVVDYVEDRDRRRLGAVRLGGVRLIDNVPQGDQQ